MNVRRHFSQALLLGTLLAGLWQAHGKWLWAQAWARLLHGT